MKNPVKEFFLFNRTERLGFSVLSVLILLSLIFRFWLAFKSREVPRASLEDQQLAAKYEAWKKMLAASSPESETGTNTAVREPFLFDPNTLDSAGFIRLGLPPRAVRGLLNWRRKGKQFRKAEDLAALYNLPPETFSRLRPYIRIAKNERLQYPSSSESFPGIVELNSADSATLDRAIPGIGAVLAHRIIQRREALGGFLRMEQLLEVYRFPDSVFRKIEERLSVNKERIQKIDLNTVQEARLSKHPYIGAAMAGNIILYRQGIGHYSQIEQLRAVPLMSEEIYRKIAPYFIIK